MKQFIKVVPFLILLLGCGEEQPKIADWLNTIEGIEVEVFEPDSRS